MKSLDPLEIYGSKINALLSRAVARDLYDANDDIMPLDKFVEELGYKADELQNLNKNKVRKFIENRI